ncbi:hypothetical protein [Candidatus Nitrospira bockiana]
MARASGSSRIAGFPSALVPGLGRLDRRQWLKGAAFLSTAMASTFH